MLIWNKNKCFFFFFNRGGKQLSATTKKSSFKKIQIHLATVLTKVKYVSARLIMARTRNFMCLAFLNVKEKWNRYLFNLETQLWCINYSLESEITIVRHGYLGQQVICMIISKNLLCDSAFRKGSDTFYIKKKSSR